MLNCDVWQYVACRFLPDQDIRTLSSTCKLMRRALTLGCTKRLAFYRLRRIFHYVQEYRSVFLELASFLLEPANRTVWFFTQADMNCFGSGTKKTIDSTRQGALDAQQAAAYSDIYLCECLERLRIVSMLEREHINYDFFELASPLYISSHYGSFVMVMDWRYTKYLGHWRLDLHRWRIDPDVLAKLTDLLIERSRLIVQSVVVDRSNPTVLTTNSSDIEWIARDIQADFARVTGCRLPPAEPPAGSDNR